MLVKIGRVAVVNMTRIDLVTIQTHEETKTTPGKGFFSAPTKTVDKTVSVKVHYVNVDGKATSHELYGFASYEEAKVVRDEILSQAKELEMEKMTAELENAIRSS